MFNKVLAYLLMYNTLLSLAYVAETGGVWQGVTLIDKSVGQRRRPQLPRRHQLAGGQTDVWVVGDARPYISRNCDCRYHLQLLLHLRAALCLQSVYSCHHALSAWWLVLWLQICE